VIKLSRVVQAPLEKTFWLLCQPQQQVELLKPVLEVELRAADAELARGSEVHLLMSRFGFSQLVRLRIEDILVGHRMTYRQTLGLFKEWVHTMQFEAIDAHQTRVIDTVDYQLPFGLVGHLLSDLWVKSDIQMLLHHRIVRANQVATAETRDLTFVADPLQG
jgi:ligand-binding SRPBCC domain-containing protein